MVKVWAALVLTATRLDQEDVVAATLDDFSPVAIEDLTPQPLPPGGLWDPTFPPPPEPEATPIHWRVFFASAGDRDRASAALAARLPDLSVEPVDVADEDWAARSQQSLTAVAAGQFVVAPPWDIPSDLDPAKTLVVIDPSRGFGTGHHASTRLCLQALSHIDLAGKRVLDLGTGSGVLAIAASLRGARAVLALDVDPDAIEAAEQSVVLNAVPVAIEFGVADFRTLSAGLKPGEYDLVLANLTGGMLQQAATRISELIAPSGVLVISGFDESEQASVRAAFAQLHQVAAYNEDNWVGLVLART